MRLTGSLKHYQRRKSTPSQQCELLATLQILRLFTSQSWGQSSITPDLRTLHVGHSLAVKKCHNPAMLLCAWLCSRFELVGRVGFEPTITGARDQYPIRNSPMGQAPLDQAIPTCKWSGPPPLWGWSPRFEEDKHSTLRSLEMSRGKNGEFARTVGAGERSRTLQGKSVWFLLELLFRRNA